ncbi:hypothetical protein BJX68DRAFT_254001 [Aspergillus pseudodeflectus]|uniref:DUF6604 domain-containing protein n=1 Tax=Aspergillus pseudodeflectus TaxID=176178 RepID=A0ABR4KNV2_9EURO
MSFDFLSSSYLQYKTDTDAVARWLVATAKTCGFPVDTLGGAPPVSSSGGGVEPSERHKGKARKLAREGATIPGATLLNKSNTPMHVIALKDFISLATKPVVKVPATFVSVLDQAISVRRDHGVHAEAQLAPGPESQEFPERHNYFIGVLEHVRQALRPRMSISNLANRFAGLDVEEPSEAFLQAPDVVIPMPAGARTDVEYEAERPPDFEEAYLAFERLLQDTRKIRRVLQETWEGYRRGMFDLVSATLTTNCALDHVQHMEEQTGPLLEAHGGTKTFLGRVYPAMCVVEGEDPINFRTYKLAESLFIPTNMCHTSFRAIVEKGNRRQILPYKADSYGKYDPTSDRSEKSPRDKMDSPGGMRKMFDAHEIPLSLVFGSQILLDIHIILRAHVEKGFDDPETYADVIKNSIKVNQEFHSNLRINTWSKSNDRAFKVLLDYMTSWIGVDFTQSTKEKLTDGILCSADYGHIISKHTSRVSELHYKAHGDFRRQAAPQSQGLPPKLLPQHGLLCGCLRAEPTIDRQVARIQDRTQGLRPNGLHRIRYREDPRSKHLEDEKLGEEETISFERNIMPKPTPKSNRKTPTKRLTITSLLETLRNTVQSEALQFAFDYLALHRICWRMLREVRKYIEEESQLPFVIGYIFMAASGTDWLGKALAKKDDVVKSRIMLEAAGVLEAFIDSPVAGGAVPCHAGVSC